MVNWRIGQYDPISKRTYSWVKTKKHNYGYAYKVGRRGKKKRTFLL